MIKYFFAKIFQKIQIPAIKNCNISKHVKIGAKSNIKNCNIGSYTYTGVACSFNNAEIGKYCSIASYVCIGGDTHPINAVSTSLIFYEKNNVFLERRFAKNNGKQQFKKVTIGNDVWIGEKAFIKSGIKIGDGAIIGANSVVTHDVLPYSIVGGCPAKIIRMRFEKEIVEKLLELKWWDLKEDKLIQLSKNFDSVDLLLKHKL